MALWRLLLFAYLVGLPLVAADDSRELGAYDDGKSWATDARDKMKQKAKDKYASTKEWAQGTKAAAASSYEDSKKRVADKREQLAKQAAEASGQGEAEKVAWSKTAFKDAFPSCTELGYVIRSHFNATLAGKIDDIFAVQACTQNMSSPVCYTFIEDTVVTLIFMAMWTPVKVGIGDVSIAGMDVNPSIALGGIKAHVKAYFRPYILIAATPAAGIIHQELSKATIDTSDSNAALLIAKASMLKSKDEMFRKTEHTIDELCAAIGLEGGFGAASDAHHLPSLCSVVYILLAMAFARPVIKS